VHHGATEWYIPITDVQALLLRPAERQTKIDITCLGDYFFLFIAQKSDYNKAIPLKPKAHAFSCFCSPKEDHMLIRDWMTKTVHTVTPDTSMMKASKMLKEHDISRLPVVDEKNRVVGIISDRDIKEASPSKATTLDVHELYYLLSEIKVKDIMTVDPFCAKPLDTVEDAAVTMIGKKIGGMPVVDDQGILQGIITDSDIFEVLITITGVRFGGVQFAFELPNTPGTLKPIVDILRDYDARIISILTSMEGPENLNKSRVVNIRIMPMDRAVENKIIDDLKSKFKMLFWARDNVHPLS